ncbi:hypothetical protein [Thermosulfuriphilus sp.]
MILSARRFLGKVEKIYVITGWVPKRLVKKIGREITNLSKGKAQIEIIAPDEI